MRDFYPTVQLIGSDSSCFESLFNSLRYSTHCNFEIISHDKPFNISSSHHFTYRNIQELDFGKREKNFFSISVIDNSFLFFKGHYMSPVNLKSEEFFFNNIKKFKYTNYFNIPSYGKLIIDMLLDFEGAPTFLGAQVHIEDNVKIYDSFSNFSKIFLKNIGQLEQCKNKIFRIEVFYHNSEKIVDIVEDKYGHHWNTYRACGINIPLLVVQNILNRKVKTLKLVDEKDIHYVVESRKPKYIFDYKFIYFDLDETLVCKDKPINNLIIFLKSEFSKKKTIKMLTRHEKDVNKTLSKIGLSSKFFKEIIIVKKDELKSKFILGSSIFIDNEFPQRRDVRSACGIPVLDLDQIDFF